MPLPDGRAARWLGLRATFPTSLGSLDAAGAWRPLSEPKPGRDPILHGWAVSGDGGTVIAVRADGTEVVIWSTGQLDAVGRVIAIPADKLSGIELSHDGRLATLLGNDLLVIDLERPARRLVLPGRGVKWARADGRSLVLLEERSLAVWDVAGRRARWRQPLASDASYQAAAYDPVSRTVVATLFGGGIRTFDVETGRQTSEFAPPLVRPDHITVTAGGLLVEATDRVTQWSLIDGAVVVSRHLAGLVAAGPGDDGRLVSARWGPPCTSAAGQPAHELILERWTALHQPSLESRSLGCDPDTSFEQFASTYARGDVVTRRLSGQRVDVAARPVRPPRVRIVSPPTARLSSPAATIHVAVEGDDVSAVRSFVEGRMIESRSAPAGGGDIALQVPLRHGINRVSVVAFARDGAASNPATVPFRHVPVAGAP